MPDEQPEHVWYRGREMAPDTYALICVTGYYHWGSVSAERADTFPEWTEDLYLQNVDTIEPERADEIRQAAEQGEEISWQLP